MTTFSETTLPVLIGTLPAGQPKGDVPALGRLTVNEAQAVNQAWLVWGMETNDKYDITATSAALFYEAEGRTLLSSSTVVTLAGSSGGGSNNAVESTTLPPVDIPVLSTQATGGGAHLTHVGSFRVFARVMNTAAAAGSVTLRMDWAVGDFGTYSTGPSTTLASTVASTLQIVNLGNITVPAVLTGTQRWEGRIVSSSTGGDKLRIDCLWLVPVDTASGEVAATSRAPVAGTLSIFDSFDQTAGNLTGKVTPVGAVTWTALQGGGTDWVVDATNHIATRSAVSDTSGSNNERELTAGTSSFASITASVDINWAIPPGSGGVNHEGGLVFRVVDTTHKGTIYVCEGPSGPVIACTVWNVSGNTPQYTSVSMAASTWYTLTVSVDAGGRVRAWWNPRGQALGSTVIDFTDSVFATGGVLATGKVGLLDWNMSAVANARSYDNFAVYTAAAATADAALFASRSLQVRHDGVIREDSTGAFWQPVSTYEGDLLRVPPVGREGRSVRFIVKASRNVPGLGPDAGIDDINATLAVTPRYLSVPAPA